LKKYESDKALILAVVDKQNLVVTDIFYAESPKVIKRLRKKLEEKKDRFAESGKSLRRSQVSLSKGDLERVMAKRVNFT